MNTAVQNTQNEIAYFESIGIKRISFELMQNYLHEIGLKLCTDRDGLFYAYLNTLNTVSYYEITTQPLDSEGISAYNINSKYYHEHTINDNSEYKKRLYELRQKYFCTKKVRGIEHIVSF